MCTRPGFPFLGNDFFGSLGDLFSCHAVDNPSMESELAMLRQYGPDVNEDIMRRLDVVKHYDNPSVEFELAMLRQYGPDVNEDIMRR